MFGRGSDSRHPWESSLTSSSSKVGSSLGGGSGMSSKSSSSSSKQKGLVSRSLGGYKFDVANFDINALSPTSW